MRRPSEENLSSFGLGWIYASNEGSRCRGCACSGRSDERATGPGRERCAQSPSTSVLIPRTTPPVGPRVILDAGASAGVTDVQFELTGGSLSDSVIATAVPTYYGWIAEWNSTTVANGSYTLQSVATEGGSKTTSPSISMTVNKPPPTVSIVVPSSGATVSGTRPCSTPSPHRG